MLGQFLSELFMLYQHLAVAAHHVAIEKFARELKRQMIQRGREQARNFSKQTDNAAIPYTRDMTTSQMCVNFEKSHQNQSIHKTNETNKSYNQPHYLALRLSIGRRLPQSVREKQPSISFGCSDGADIQLPGADVAFVGQF